MLIIVLSFLVWAYLFEIDETVRANGEVVAQSRLQVIQVTDGGVLDALNVSEGDFVSEGQTLAILESDRAGAAVDELNAHLDALATAKIRAQAEANGEMPDFSSLSNLQPNVVAAQMALYVENKFNLDKNLANANNAYDIAQQELETIEELEKLGDSSRMELFQAQMGVIDRQSKISEIANRFKVDARREIADLEQQMSSLEFKIKQRTSVLKHTQIVSPVDGIVTSISINTLGGVLRPGQELMKITPANDNYVIEAKITPPDIGRLEVGLPALVRLGAFDYTIYGGLQGELSYISADTLTEQDPTTGRGLTFYRARISVDPNNQTNKKLDPKAALKPGIPTTIDINTGKRSVLTFIAKPVTRAFSGSLSQK